MANIIHRVGIRATVTQVYNALSTIKGLSGWWTEEVTGDEEIEGNIRFTFRLEDGTVKGTITMQVKEPVPDTKVQWHCIDGPAEWIGTSLTFDLSEQDGQTILLFAHRNWHEEVEFMAHCSMKWAVFLLSLRSFAETGTGQPSPYDVKIDNWN